MQLLSLDGGSGLAAGLSGTLEQPLLGVEHRPFDDGEHKWRLTADPRGEDVVVVASLHGDDVATPQDKLVRLLVTTATLRDHGASRVTALLPYLAYARKDVRTQPFDPLTSRLVAQWLEASGCDQVIALEAHNPSAFENAHRIPALHLDAWPAFDGAVQAMARVCDEADRAGSFTLDQAFLHRRFTRPDQAIAMAALFTAAHMQVQAIVSLTQSGSTALWISRLDAGVPIYALTSEASSQRRMALYRETHPIFFNFKASDRENLLREAEQHLLELGIVKPGDLVLMTVGEPIGKSGGTNTLKIVSVGDHRLPRVAG